jgi:hypothetical protein
MGEALFGGARILGTLVLYGIVQLKNPTGEVPPGVAKSVSDSAEQIQHGTAKCSH